MAHDYISMGLIIVWPAGRRDPSGNSEGGQCRGASAGALPGQTGGQPDQKRFQTV